MKGLLLINLGSPDSTKVSDVKKYLDEFLMRRRIRRSSFSKILVTTKKEKKKKKKKNKNKRTRTRSVREEKGEKEREREKGRQIK